MKTKIKNSVFFEIPAFLALYTSGDATANPAAIQAGASSSIAALKNYFAAADNTAQKIADKHTADAEKLITKINEGFSLMQAIEQNAEASAAVLAATGEEITQKLTSYTLNREETEAPTPGNEPEEWDRPK